MGTEVLAFADIFDFGYKIRHDLQRIVGQKLPLAMFMDRDSLFKTIVRSTTTTEIRLMIDLVTAREAYGIHEISSVGWIRSEDNPADHPTKPGPCTAIELPLDTGRIDVLFNSGSCEHHCVTQIADRDFGLEKFPTDKECNKRLQKRDPLQHHRGHS